MCGLAGVLRAAHEHRAELADVARRMAATLEHRGPDDAGEWADPDVGVALGHRRLRVIELSPAGGQPMVSSSGRYVVAYNGEIYNHVDLRSGLRDRGHGFRGRSDTEVLLAMVEEYGLVEALTRFDGMFAFALWDRQRRRLHLCRDRLGEKPLYVGRLADGFCFASELRALREVPGFVSCVDRSALALYLERGHLPAPWSILEGVRKVRPGTVLTLTGRPEADQVEQTYWPGERIAEHQARHRRDGPADPVVDELEVLMTRSVDRRLVADVPLGVFLSGGVDSSLIAGLTHRQIGGRTRTFAVGFDDPDLDEAPFARAVAAHLGTDHTEVYLGADEALDLVPRLPDIWDEPFGDSSQIPTHLVSRVARREGITVALSGDGGDELFGGYTRYARTRRLWNVMRLVPHGLRAPLAERAARIPATAWDRAGGPFRRAGVADGRILGDTAVKLAHALQSRDGREVYARVLSHSKDVAPVRGVSPPGTMLTDPDRYLTLPTLDDHMTVADTLVQLPAILTKVDRAAMAVGLETRMPLLDHEIVEFAWSVPPGPGGGGPVPKWPLRRLLDRYVPRELVDRPKRGFAIPLARWLRGPLRPWADDLLDRDRLHDEGLLDADVVSRCWSEHRRQERDWQFLLWDVLAFQAWHQRWEAAS